MKRNDGEWSRTKQKYEEEEEEEKEEEEEDEAENCVHGNIFVSRVCLRRRQRRHEAIADEPWIQVDTGT